MQNVVKYLLPIRLLGNHIENKVASDNIKLCGAEVITLEPEWVVLLESQSVRIKSLPTSKIKTLVARNTIKESLTFHPLHRSGKGLAAHRGQMGLVHKRDYMPFK